MSKWTLYMLRLKNGHYYTGITTNLDKRLKDHESGKGSKYVRSQRPFELAFKQGVGNTRSLAQKFEYKFKKLSHHDKDELSKFYLLLCAVDLGLDVKKAYKKVYR